MSQRLRSRTRWCPGKPPRRHVPHSASRLPPGGERARHQAQSPWNSTVFPHPLHVPELQLAIAWPHFTLKEPCSPAFFNFRSCARRVRSRTPSSNACLCHVRNYFLTFATPPGALEIRPPGFVYKDQGPATGSCNGHHHKNKFHP